MWISNTQEWDTSHTELSKYFIEKINQQVDALEVISNKHKTSNGLTLIAEIIKVATITKSRSKFKNRLISLLKESNSNFLSTNIANDFLLNKYFKDIVKYYKEIVPEKVAYSETDINLLITKSKIYLKRLLDHYYNYLTKELEYIDFKSEKFEKESTKIDLIIECCIPYLLFLGYSSTSIREISNIYIMRSRGPKSPRRIIKHFDGKISEFDFLIITEKLSNELLFIKENLNIEKVKIESVTLVEANEYFLEESPLQLNSNQELYKLTTFDTDPHNFLRNIYDEGLKRYVASCDRLTLNYFTHFFDNVYWKFTNAKQCYQNSKINLDPVNVPERGSTLRYTLSKLNNDYNLNYDDKKGIPYMEILSPIIYFYNLALGSKSIENSLSLLWTSLEMLLPYRIKEYDIQNVQHFVSKSLSVGSISRELVALGIRLSEYQLRDNIIINDIPDIKNFNYQPQKLADFASWISNEYPKDDPKDPYLVFKETSNLLCKKYCHLNNVYTGVDKNKSTVKYWLDKIKSSEEAITFQLDRIYLHRNQVVHSGQFINEYSNLWSHLEWYVGKLIAYAAIQIIKEENDLETIFIGLEADNEQLIMLLKSHEEKKISEITDLFELVFKHSWQSF